MQPEKKSAVLEISRGSLCGRTGTVEWRVKSKKQTKLKCGPLNLDVNKENGACQGCTGVLDSQLFALKTERQESSSSVGNPL